MTTINVRQRNNVLEIGHVQAHTIKKLEPTAKGPKAKITHIPDKMTPKNMEPKSAKNTKGKKTMMDTH